MTRFLSSPSLDTLLADLAQHGFTFDTEIDPPTTPHNVFV